MGSKGRLWGSDQGSDVRGVDESGWMDLMGQTAQSK